MAEQFLDNGFTVIPVKGKSVPPAGATGRNGSVTAEKIKAWSEDFEWAMQNTAIRHGRDTIAVDVDHYGDATGADTLADLEAKLGDLPATITSTARGADSPSRQHIFILPEEVELVGTAGPNIDIIQFSHRYTVCAPSIHPETLQPYVFYDADGEPMDELPTVGDLEILPQAWLDYLRKPLANVPTIAADGEFHTVDPYDGPQVEAASEDERRQLDSIIAEFDALPRVWAPGAGWRSTMFRLACWLLRMANSNAYALTEDQALQIVLDRCPTDDQWGVNELMVQWESAKSQTAGAFADLPADLRPKLLEPMAAMNALPADLYELAMTEPSTTDLNRLWGIRSQILRGVLSAGLPDELATSVAWHSAHAGAPLRNDPSGITKLWRELDRARADVAREGSVVVAPAPPSERPPLPADPAAPAAPTSGHITLLADFEREFLAGPGGEWWGTRYIKWAQQTYALVNEPYFRLNRWFVLSVIFGDKAIIPMAGDHDAVLNVYGIITGPSGSGKTESLKPASKILQAFYGDEDNPDIGDNATYAALTKVLILRDGRTSFFHVDEADGTIVAWSDDRGEFRGMKQGITKFYDGTVAAIQRSTDADISGIHAKAYLSVHLMGTVEKMIDAIQPGDWESGFINRFVWVSGERKERKREDKRFASRRGARVPGAGGQMYAQWAAEFRQSIGRLIPVATGAMAEMLISEEASDRHLDMVEAFEKIARSSPYESRLESTFTRLSNTVMKCAALIAAAEGTTTVTLRHLLIAIEQAEEWAANILYMVQATNQTREAREAAKLERFVASQPGRRCSLSTILRHPDFPRGRRHNGELVGELAAQGRVRQERDPVTGEETVYIL